MVKTKEINGRNFKVEKFHAVKAFKLKTKLAKILLEPLAACLEGGALSSTNILDNEVDLSKAVHLLFENIENEDKLFSLILEILNKTALVEGENDEMFITNEKAFDYVFRDGLKDLYELIAFVISVNYSDLLEVVGGNIGGLKSMLQPTQESKRRLI